MKYYVTVKRTQNLTFCITADREKVAKEEALLKAETDDTPYDVSDATYEIVACMTHTEILQSLRNQRNKLN